MFDSLEDDLDSLSDTMDTSPDFGTPRVTPFLCGHELIEKSLLQRVQDNQLPQALLFSGPEGIGKATMAFRLARFLLSGHGNVVDEGPSLFRDDPLPTEYPTSLDVPVTDAAVQLITAGAHPDLLVIEREVNQDKGTQKSTIGVGQIRAIADILHLRPSNENGWRVVIVDDADTMTLEAQNGLLKMLEEPPARCIFMLIAHRQGQLLPTIYSRVQKIRFGYLSSDICRSILTYDAIWSELSTEIQDVCLFLGNYAPGQVMRILPIIQAKGLELLLQDMQNFDQNATEYMPILMERAGGQQAPDMPMYALFERLVLTLAHFAVVQAHQPDTQSGQAMPQILQEIYGHLVARHSTQDLLATHDALNDLFLKTRQQNLDRRASVGHALSIWRGKL